MSWLEPIEFRGRLVIAGLVALSMASSLCAQSASPTDADVDRMVERLIEELKTRQVTAPGPQMGAWEDERSGMHAGGVSALATFALLKAGVPWHDEVIQRAVEYLAEHPLPGTYSRSLRVAVWAHLSTRVSDPKIKARIRRLLQADTDWLIKAMKPDGLYGYNMEGLGGDHSCTQFGVLGMWAAETALAEVQPQYWQRVNRHWRGTQLQDGSWAYSTGQRGTNTMTTGGVNTLYITLAQLFARREPAYVGLRGVPGRGRGTPDIAATVSAADRGLGWLSENDLFPSRGYPGYQLFGLERLGVASGLKYIGEVDWYREGVTGIDRQPRASVEAAFQLLFLTYGRAPVLINKLRHGPGDDWNRHYRDLHFLTGWLSQKHERIYKWQIVTVDSPLHDLLDAPTLLISGEDEVKLSATQRARLLEYLDAGGTIIGHADRANKRFAGSFRRTFEALCAERGWTFELLPAEHPLFHAVHGRGEPGWAEDLRIEGMGDPARTCVLLFPMDVAGAWHQNRHRKHPELFDLMTNLRAYCAPKYELLPKRLRPRVADGSEAPLVGYLTLSVVSALEDEKPKPWVWRAFSTWFVREKGVDILTLDNASVGSVDILHLSAQSASRLTTKTRDTLVEFLRSGSFLLIEGARPASAESVRESVKQLADALGGEVAPIDPDHPLLTGAVPSGIEPADLQPNRWGLSTLRGEVPPIQTVTADGRMVAMFVPFDLLATASGHFLWETPAYSTATSRTLLTNLLAWRYQLAVGKERFARTPRPATRRGIESLIPLAQASFEQADYATAGRIVHLAARLAADSELLSSWRGLAQRKITEAIREANSARRFEEARRLGQILIDLVPDLADDREPLTLPEEAPHELPEGLADIAVTFNDQETTALVLLREWFKWRAQHATAMRDFDALLIRGKAFDDRAAELIRQHRADRTGRQKHARSSGKHKRYRGPEFEEIARQRQELEAEIATVDALLETLESRMDQLTEALRPHVEEVTPYGITLEDDEWVLQAP